jgi:SAM-dependent methyltransferase
MLEKAKNRCASQNNVEYSLLDMQDMSQFDDVTFDMATACYAYMFPEDKQLAIKETYRILKPGGCLIATYWLDLPSIRLCGAVMREVLGSPPPPPPINPMSLSAPGLFDDMLTKAGFQDLETETDQYPFDMSADKDLQYKLATFPLKGGLDSIGGDAHARSHDAFWKHVGDYATVRDNGSMEVGPNVFAMVVARKPMLI